MIKQEYFDVVVYDEVGYELIEWYMFEQLCEIVEYICVVLINGLWQVGKMMLF